jgi:hypothetical protein
MDIEIRKNHRGWIAEVWTDHNDDRQFKGTLDEEKYVEINAWCIHTIGYHARTAYHIFEFKKKTHLDWFLLRWH